MLRDIYLSAGGVGTFFIAVGMFVTFIGWWMAITATVTREGLNGIHRAAIILLVSLFPPLGILVSGIYIRREGRKVTKAMKGSDDSAARSAGGLRLSVAQRSAKAA